MTLIGSFEETATCAKTAGNQVRRRTGRLAVAAAVAALATACSVQTYTSYPTGPAGSVTYRQELAFLQCMRGHGALSWPNPPPGGSISIQLPRNGAGKQPADPQQRAIDACKHLLPTGGHTDVRVVIG